jgi:hypothetical protein
MARSRHGAARPAAKPSPACAACHKPITHEEDLVVVSELRHFPLAAYHNEHYAGQLKRSLLTYGGTRPLNGRVGTLAAAATAIFALAFAVVVGWFYTLTGLSTALWPVGVLVLWAALAVGVRYEVYRRYERPLRR